MSFPYNDVPSASIRLLDSSPHPAGDWFYYKAGPHLLGHHQAFILILDLMLSRLLALAAVCVMVCLVPGFESHDCPSAEPLVAASATTLPSWQQPHLWPNRNRAWHFTCWLCVSNFIIYALCRYNWQKMRRGDQSPLFSGLDGATKTGPVTLMIFKRSPFSLGAVHNSPASPPSSPWR